jgi:hypothetical protein
MKQLSKLSKLMSVIAVGVVVLAGSASAYAASSPAAQTPPDSKQLVSGPQAKAPFEPGSKDAKVTAPLGPTNLVATNEDGSPKAAAVTPLTGAVAGVDFQNFYNYCSRNLAYPTVKNTTTVTKYIQVKVYNQGAYHEITTSLAAGATSYPAFYGINGAYSAYLYVWNGSTYQYDEYKGGTNTCNVSVTRTSNAGGWVQLKIQNLGTAYASQVSTELAPFPATGTYTGTKYDYPVAGGAAIYRWFYVGTQPYGITSSTSGSFNSPYIFTGDL